jgi:hypothetical protein
LSKVFDSTNDHHNVITAPKRAPTLADTMPTINGNMGVVEAPELDEPVLEGE